MARDDGGLFVTKSIIVKMRFHTSTFWASIDISPQIFVYLVLFIDPHWLELVDLYVG